MSAAALPRGGHLSMCAGPYGPDAVALGLPEVLLLLAAQAKTAPGRNLCLQPSFAADPAECRESFRVVAEAIEASRTEPPPFLHDLAILDGGLNPLKFCQDTVVAEFERLSLCECAHIIAANERTAVGSHNVGGGVNRLDDFFPFDPLLLRFASERVHPLYKTWEPLPDPHERASNVSSEAPSETLGASFQVRVSPRRPARLRSRGRPAASPRPPPVPAPHRSQPLTLPPSQMRRRCRLLRTTWTR